MQKAVRWPCGVSGRGVGNDSIQWTSRQQWVHRKCSGIKGSMYKVLKSFACRGCVNPVTGTWCTSVDIVVNANLELVDKFCYLGNMLSVDRDDDAAVETRTRIGWNKFRQLVPLLTNKDISLIVIGRLYSSCVQSSMWNGSETWLARKENEVALQWAEMRMVRWMCGITLQDRLPRKGLRETRIRWHNFCTTVKQVLMVWACVAKRRQWLGEEDQRKLESDCGKTLSGT